MSLPQPISQSVVFRPRKFLIAVSVCLVVLLPASAVAGKTQLQCSPALARFGSVVVGQSSTMHVAVTNTGTTTVKITAMSTSSAPAYSVANLVLPLTLTSGQSADFDIVFTPTGNGWTGGAITLASNAANSTLYIRVGGVGVVSEALSPSPSTVSFGNVSVGSSATVPLTLTNTGTSNVILAQAESTGTGFSFTSPTLPVTIAPKKSLVLSVLFAPTAAGAATGTIVVHNGGLSITLSGTGTVGALSIAPTAMNFGNVNLGSTGTLPLTLTATGGNVVISSASSSSAQFALQGATFPFTINSGQTATFNATFAPAKAGSTSGNFSFVTSTSSSQVLEALSGIGMAVQYTVNLSWSPSTSSVVGYNIYRAGTSQGPYSRINSAVDGNTAYSDNTVASGQTYFYAATSVDSTGTESSYSALAQAVIP